jgi:hypothetical protein
MRVLLQELNDRLLLAHRDERVKPLGVPGLVEAQLGGPRDVSRW